MSGESFVIRTACAVNTSRNLVPLKDEFKLECSIFWTGDAVYIPHSHHKANFLIRTTPVHGGHWAPLRAEDRFFEAPECALSKIHGTSEPSVHQSQKYDATRHAVAEVSTYL